LVIPTHDPDPLLNRSTKNGDPFVVTFVFRAPAFNVTVPDRAVNVPAFVQSLDTVIA
jgi:hypothetical protein